MHGVAPLSRVYRACVCMILEGGPHRYASTHVRGHVDAVPCRGETRHDVSVFFIPRRSLLCERLLKAEGVWADINIADIPVNWVPFDTDVLSLEIDTAFRVCALPSARDSASSSVGANNFCQFTSSTARLQICSGVLGQTAIPVSMGYVFLVNQPHALPRVAGASVQRGLQLAIWNRGSSGAAAADLWACQSPARQRRRGLSVETHVGARTVRTICRHSKRLRCSSRTLPQHNVNYSPSTSSHAMRAKLEAAYQTVVHLMSPKDTAYSGRANRTCSARRSEDASGCVS